MLAGVKPSHYKCVSLFSHLSSIITPFTPPAELGPLLGRFHCSVSDQTCTRIQASVYKRAFLGGYLLQVFEVWEDVHVSE